MIQVKSLLLGDGDANCFLVTDEATGKSALIDCAVWNPQMQTFIGDADLEYILLTHGHYDHILGVADMQKTYGCHVAIHLRDAAMLKNPALSLAIHLGLEQAEVVPDTVLQDGDTVMLGESEIKVLHTPGHTLGSVCFMCGAHLFTGDLLFKGTCGRTDLPGGDWDTMKQSLRRVRDLEGDYQVYPGHSQLTTLQREREYNRYLLNI